MAEARLSCRELVEIITEYLEGALPARDRARFEAHLGECEGCTSYLEQIRTTIRLTGELTEDSLSVEARRDLLEAFRNWRAR